MRQRAKHQINAVKVDIFDCGQARQINMAEVRVDVRHGHARLGVPRKRHNLHRGVLRDQADEFCARVA